MAIYEPALEKSIAGYVEAPRISIRFRLLRDGEVTTGPKMVRLFRSWGTVAQLEMIFFAEDGEYSPFFSFNLATLLAQGDWLVCGDDAALPKKTRADWLSLSEGGTYTFNITSGEGGEAGSPATVDALVRVDGAWADRQVVVVERPVNGLWRVAGYGPTPGGAGTIDLKITDGQCYALGLDDWGVVFTADLDVLPDQTIRPSVYTGWLYRITEAGRLPPVEPEWWAGGQEGDTRPLGTARAVAVRYYQPIGYGPITVERT